MEPNRWHDANNLTHTTLAARYRTVRTTYRRSLQSLTRIHEIDWFDEIYVNAAMVFGKELDFDLARQSMRTATWSLLTHIPGDHFYIVLYSVADPEAWVRQWSTRGIRAWAWFDRRRVFDFEYYSARIRQQTGDVPTSDPAVPVRRGRGRPRSRSRY